jgi:hypothetical protein
MTGGTPTSRKCCGMDIIDRGRLRTTACISLPAASNGPASVTGNQGSMKATSWGLAYLSVTRTCSSTCSVPVLDVILVCSATNLADCGRSRGTMLHDLNDIVRGIRLGLPCHSASSCLEPATPPRSKHMAQTLEHGAKR